MAQIQQHRSDSIEASPINYPTQKKQQRRNSTEETAQKKQHKETAKKQQQQQHPGNSTKLISINSK